MKVHKNQWLLTMLYPLVRLAGATRRGQTMAPEGQKPSKWLCLPKLPREMYPQPIVHKALSWGAIRKSACILAEITIRKSQEFICNGHPEEVLPRLDSLGGLDSFTDAVRERVGMLEFVYLVEGIKFYGLGRLAKENALEYLSKSRSWNQTNEIITSAIIPLFEYLDVDDIERIIHMPTQTEADLLGANSYSVFIEHVRRASIMETATLDRLLSENRASYLVPQEEDQT
jgi:hypothetical protein